LLLFHYPSPHPLVYWNHGFTEKFLAKYRFGMTYRKNIQNKADQPDLAAGLMEALLILLRHLHSSICFLGDKSREKWGGRLWGMNHALEVPGAQLSKTAKPGAAIFVKTSALKN
jgi:hypothetical protein